VQLPPLRIAGTAFTTLLDSEGRPAQADRLEARRRALTELFEASRPDVVVTELFPFGRRVLAPEFMPLLERAAAADWRPLVLVSVRDILVAPSKPTGVPETHARLRRFYDAVLVHGDPELIPLDVTWPVDETLRGLIRYTGYVDDGRPAAGGGGDARGDIVVSGGSSAASLPLYRAAISAAALVAERRWRIPVGGGVSPADLASLAEGSGTNVVVERARPDFRELIGRAAASVSQAGYNTVVDLLRAGTPAVLVPFEGGRETEQRLRAERLSERGIAVVLPEADLTSENLATCVRKALSAARPTPPSIRLDGAEQSVAIIEELAAAPRRRPLGKAADDGRSWAILDEALRRLADSGRTVRLWWRDDDAVTVTPELERLLALARRFDFPLGLAAVPAKAERALFERLAREPRVRVLVHGLAHKNHAPPSEKKAEFGPHRPIERLAEEAAEALRRARAVFDGCLLPVFVPPWNRIAAELVPMLPANGYRGLSGAGEASLADGLALRQVNTQVDPVDWQGGRGLRSREMILADVAGAIHDRIERDASRPIGLLTHHLVHDEPTWVFCEALLSRLARAPNLRFEGPDAVFC
jgi:predicted glycosyltransferase